eukprot:1160226-Pelagomonas_calceolata.AAC.2
MMSCNKCDASVASEGDNRLHSKPILKKLDTFHAHLPSHTSLPAFKEESNRAKLMPRQNWLSMLMRVGIGHEKNTNSVIS